MTLHRRSRSTAGARLVLAVLAVLLAACSSPGAESSPPADDAGALGETPAASSGLSVTEVAAGLRAPWGVGFLPDGTALVNERDTALLRSVAPDGAVTDVGPIDGVAPGGEGGLLGLAVSPDFAQDGLVFVYFTAAEDNRVEALTLRDGVIAGRRLVLEGIPKAGIHNGGRIIFGPDGLLYVGTGDASEREAAQDLGNLGGKILRMRPDGSPAPDHPFAEAPLIYSLGHRNVQGLAFDSAGNLWAAEFGQNTWDELNRITAGANYGWPVVEGPSDDANFAAPSRVWDTGDASPSGIAVYEGSVWMAGLGGERLWQIPITGTETAEPIAHFVEEYGRLRTVEPAPDGSLWLTTSNTDGRGDVREGDDRIQAIRLS